MEPARRLGRPLDRAGPDSTDPVLLTATLTIHVVPRARRSGIAGRHGDAIRVRLTAPPVDGAANAELVRFLAERLDVPRGAVAIQSGATGRRKTVTIDGYTAATATRVLLESEETS